MRRYLLRRLLLLVPTLLGVSIVAFAIMHLIPGDVVDALIGTEATLTPEARETLRRILGVDQPVYRQYLSWLGGLLRGDFGVSLISRAPVAETLLRGLPVTLELAILSTLIAPAFGFETAFVTVGILLVGLAAVLVVVTRTQRQPRHVTESIFIAPGRGD